MAKGSTTHEAPSRAKAKRKRPARVAAAVEARRAAVPPPPEAIAVAPVEARTRAAAESRKAEPAPESGAGLDALWSAHPLSKLLPLDWGEITRALTTVATQSAADPVRAANRAVETGMRLWQDAAEIWIEATARWLGQALPARSETAAVESDRRFDAPEWQNHPFFRLLKRSYLTLSEQLLDEAERQDLDPGERQRVLFHLRQLVDAASPTLFLPTNPAALRKALETGGGSIADGLRNLIADLNEGRLSMTDAEAFAPGRNLALSPGKVVLRNRLIELIQYAPMTAETRAVPLLFIPPWINKYYILDLQPKNSLVRFLVEQGFSVFMISWKNPDAAMESITFDAYMTEGPLAASEAVRAITGADEVSPIGYCIGGTLLAMTLAWLAARGERRFGPATFMVSLQDFAEVGDTAVFMDEPQIAFMERQMMERGYLDSRHMANMFNLLRANDLIWSTVVNNYLLGNKPPAFDLLYWNSDGTRMARAAHSFYLRNTYLENNLIVPGKVSLLDVPIDLRRIDGEVYAVGAEKDHIVPWRSAWRIAQLTRARTRFVLAASGHIAGMINPPSKGKGGYWVNDSASAPASAEAWLEGAAPRTGSWWTDWAAWLGERCGAMRPAPEVGSRAYPPLADAPGSYVLER